ncbi:MAG: GNAT family N-acetyltransferase [Candidatus Lokiarchaeota archaeon]|nr:GNAT family N-acetyltransferase [Candidatus Lokiarchaeota archaeon]MBD3199042.1 GNAT family N-acetyltransferase [Candidatus Lokiarchaeota archaeon]
MGYRDFAIKRLSKDNIKQVYEMCENNVLYVSHSLDDFKKTTIYSKLFDPKLTAVLYNNKNQIIAFFMLLFRKSLVFKKRRKVLVLKFFVVEKTFRNKGIGTYLLLYLEEKANSSSNNHFYQKFDVMASMPDYWYPGLDPRHSEALFFLNKHEFKKKGERINLCLNLESISNSEPKCDFEEYYITRVKQQDKSELIPLKFMSIRYRLSFWPEEIELTFKNDPISTFIARSKQTGEIIGWASHSIQFMGSFGPTGVKKKERGKGIGKNLLKWCLWDIKQIYNVKKVKINWVEMNNAYFYLKTTGARICEFYWVMQKRI